MHGHGVVGRDGVQGDPDGIRRRGPRGGVGVSAEIVRSVDPCILRAFPEGPNQVFDGRGQRDTPNAQSLEGQIPRRLFILRQLETQEGFYHTHVTGLTDGFEQANPDIWIVFPPEGTDEDRTEVRVKELA